MEGRPLAVSRRPPRFSNRRASRKGAAQPQHGYILRVIDGQHAGKEFFFQGEATIGRVENNQIVLVEPGISRNHARIFSEGGIFLLQDLGSINGTRLNGEKITEDEVLRDGDYLTLGQSTLQFSLLEALRGEATAPTRLPETEAQSIDNQTMTRQSPLPRVKLWLRPLWAKVLAILVLVLLIAGGVRLAFFGGGQLVIFDQSNTPVPYAEDDAFFNAVFGYGQYDRTHRDQVIITFEYLGGRATLQYGAWGIDKVKEVEILLNDEVVGKVPVTMQRWVYGLKELLPRDKLQKGSKNTITFRNTLNPAAKEQWEICYVEIIQEAIPPPDLEEARHQFELAKKAWEDREIEPGNMYTALVGFKRARDLMENLTTRPELYQEAVDQIEKVDRALTRKFADGLFSARRAEKVDHDPQRARDLLKQTLKFFRKDDFRFREVQRYLDSLSEM